MSVLQREELTLLALALAQGRVLTRMYLQKAVLVLQEELLATTDVELERPYEFQKRQYGGYSLDIYADARRYADSGLVTLADMCNDGPFAFSATNEGTLEGYRILGRLPIPFRERARAYVEWVEGHPNVTQLAQAVYDLFPEYEENSVVKRSRKVPGEAVFRIDSIKSTTLHTRVLNAIRWISSVGELSNSKVAQLIGVDLSTLSLWNEGGTIPLAEELRVLDVADVLKRVAARLHTPRAIRAWLDTRGDEDMKTPAELLAQGYVDRARFLAVSDSTIGGLATSPVSNRRDIADALSRSAEGRDEQMTPDSDISMSDLFDSPPIRRHA